MPPRPPAVRSGREELVTLTRPWKAWDTGVAISGHSPARHTSTPKPRIHTRAYTHTHAHAGTRPGTCARTHTAMPTPTHTQVHASVRAHTPLHTPVYVPHVHPGFTYPRALTHVHTHTHHAHPGPPIGGCTQAQAGFPCRCQPLPLGGDAGDGTRALSAWSQAGTWQALGVGGPPTRPGPTVRRRAASTSIMPRSRLWQSGGMKCGM